MRRRERRMGSTPPLSSRERERRVCWPKTEHVSVRTLSPLAPRPGLGLGMVWDGYGRQHSPELGHGMGWGGRHCPTGLGHGRGWNGMAIPSSGSWTWDGMGGDTRDHHRHRPRHPPPPPAPPPPPPPLVVLMLALQLHAVRPTRMRYACMHACMHAFMRTYVRT